MNIYIHANCQASAIARMLADNLPAISIKSREAHVIDVARDREAFLVDIAEADVVICQPIADGYRGVDFLSLSYVRDHVTPGTTVLTFPSIFFRGHHPQIFYARVIPNVPGAPPYHDAHILALYADGHSPAEIAELVGSEHFLAPEFVKAEADQSLRDLALREEAAAIDLPLSAFIAEHLAEDRLFHTINHPQPLLFAQLCRAVSERLDLPWPAERPPRDYLSIPSLPLYPSVKAALQIDSPRVSYRLRHGEFSLQDYVAWVTPTYDEAGGPAVIRREIAGNPDLQAYLQRFASVARAFGPLPQLSAPFSRPNPMANQ
ncbi:hypothetical protein DFR49_0840 [Hephaestia caeni]|uniref:Polysaccharide biosynthesis enzyme WcbI domain-containing protein n=1 Tax=Hephaestia caeni TaxID=645617 RepID=A0A397PB31_9SPHN|nr:WcbI family polysaccharide biosynthesis putative acetyltransferase [Hephaestia caeni]RIA46302.1 hypothetical protein DFR49_0840 [Hephaestia caeni]